jgi:hypothetical protein
VSAKSIPTEQVCVPWRTSPCKQILLGFQFGSSQLSCPLSSDSSVIARVCRSQKDFGRVSSYINTNFPSLLFNLLQRSHLVPLCDLCVVILLICTLSVELSSHFFFLFFQCSIFCKRKKRKVFPVSPHAPQSSNRLTQLTFICLLPILFLLQSVCVITSLKKKIMKGAY